jgi:hypothetical protein
MSTPPPIPPRPDRKPTQRHAVIATVVGALSIVLFFPFGPILGPIAIVMGRNARRQATNDRTGLATTGIVLGAIGLIAGAAVWILGSACDCL